MSRASKNRSRFTPEDVEEAMRLAEELEQDEIRSAIDRMVRDDTVFTWTLAALYVFVMMAFASGAPLLPEPHWHPEMRSYIGVGFLTGVLIAVSIRFSTDRVQRAYILFLAYRIKSQHAVRPPPPP